MNSSFSRVWNNCESVYIQISYEKDKVHSAAKDNLNLIIFQKKEKISSRSSLPITDSSWQAGTLFGDPLPRSCQTGLALRQPSVHHKDHMLRTLHPAPAKRNINMYRLYKRHSRAEGGGQLVLRSLHEVKEAQLGQEGLWKRWKADVTLKQKKETLT